METRLTQWNNGQREKGSNVFLLSGLDSVDYGDKDKTACLLSAELGAGSLSLADQDQTACVQLNPVLPIVSGLCESDPCLNVAWQNNWATDSYVAFHNCFRGKSNYIVVEQTGGCKGKDTTN